MVMMTDAARCMLSPAILTGQPAGRSFEVATAIAGGDF
jgi:hypothetical protein